MGWETTKSTVLKAVDSSKETAALAKVLFSVSNIRRVHAAPWGMLPASM